MAERTLTAAAGPSPIHPYHCASSCAPRRITGLALSEPTPATPRERRAASKSSCRLSAADLVARASIVPPTPVRAAVCAAVRRVTSPRLILLSSSHLARAKSTMRDSEAVPSALALAAPAALAYAPC